MSRAGELGCVGSKKYSFLLRNVLFWDIKKAYEKTGIKKREV
jgi:hypothetical protein